MLTTIIIFVAVFEMCNNIVFCTQIDFESSCELDRMSGLHTQQNPNLSGAIIMKKKTLSLHFSVLKGDEGVALRGMDICYAQTLAYTLQELGPVRVSGMLLFVKFKRDYKLMNVNLCRIIFLTVAYLIVKMSSQTNLLHQSTYR